MEIESALVPALLRINIDEDDKLELLEMFQKFKDDIKRDDAEFFSILNKFESS
jgi:hypothetical protein